MGFVVGEVSLPGINRFRGGFVVFLEICIINSAGIIVPTCAVMARSSYSATATLLDGTITILRRRPSAHIVLLTARKMMLGRDWCLSCTVLHVHSISRDCHNSKYVKGRYLSS